MGKKHEVAENDSAGEELEVEAEVIEGEAVSCTEDLALMLEDARSKADENWDLLVRARAETENLRKRHQRDIENAHKFALERFVAEMILVCDSMEFGLSAAQDDDADVNKLCEGMGLTLKLFSDAMERFSVFQINPEGQSFNPELHQAMSMQPRDDVPPNMVVDVVQKGYTLNGRLVRPAMVVVSQASPPPVGKIDEQA